MFFWEQPFYGDYSRLDSHTNTVISHMFPYLSTVRNIPSFRDSCDVMELLFSGKMADKTRVQCSRGSQAYFQGFHDAYTIFLRVLRNGIHNGSASWNIQHILWLISPFKQLDTGEIFGQGRSTSISLFTDFWRSSRYFSMERYRGLKYLEVYFCVRGTRTQPLISVGCSVQLIREGFLRLHLCQHTFASLWGACLRFASLWRANSRGDSCVLGVHLSNVYWRLLFCLCKAYIF